MQIKDYYIYQKKNSPFYYSRFTYEDGSYSAFSTKKTDEKEANKTAAAEMNKRNEDDKKKQHEEKFIQKNIILKDYAPDFFSLSGKYIQKRKAFNSSINDRWIIEKQAIVNNHILPSHLADKYLREISEEDIELFIVKLKSVNPDIQLSANTKNKILMILKIILREAYKEKLIDRIPVIDIKIQGEKKEKDILKVEEIQSIFPERWETIWPDRRAYVGCLIACTTGARLSEIMGLQIKHIDFTNKTIHIKQSFDKKLQIINPTPKNKQSRQVVICDKVLNEIKQLIAENPDNKNKDSFLLHGEIPGKPFDHKYLPRHFFNALKKVNIDIEEKALTFHAIRHSVNTHLLLAGINYLKIKRFLGHSDKSSDMTALYSHIDFNDMEDIRNYFSNMLTRKANLKVIREATA